MPDSRKGLTPYQLATQIRQRIRTRLAGDPRLAQVNAMSDDDLLHMFISEAPELARNVDWPLGSEAKFAQTAQTVAALHAQGKTIGELPDLSGSARMDTPATFAAPPEAQSPQLIDDVSGALTRARVADPIRLGVGLLQSALERAKDPRIGGMLAPLATKYLPTSPSAKDPYQQSAAKFATSFANTATAGLIPAARRADAATSVAGTDTAGLAGQIAGLVVGMKGAGMGVGAIRALLAKRLGLAAMPFIESAIGGGAMQGEMEANRLRESAAQGQPLPSASAQLADIALQQGIGTGSMFLGGRLVPQGSAQTGWAATRDWLAQRIAAIAAESGTNAATTWAMLKGQKALGGVSLTPEQEAETIKMAAMIGAVGGGLSGPQGRAIRPAEAPLGTQGGVSPTQPVPQAGSPLLKPAGPRPSLEVPNSLGDTSGLPLPGPGQMDPFNPQAPVATGDPFSPWKAPTPPMTTAIALRPQMGMEPGTQNFQHLGGSPVASAAMPISGEQRLVPGSTNFQRMGQGPLVHELPLRDAPSPSPLALPAPRPTSIINLPLVNALDAAGKGATTPLRTLLQEGIPDDLVRVLGISRVDKARLTRGQLTENLKTLRTRLDEGPFEVVGRFTTPDSGVWRGESGQTLSSVFWSGVAAGARQVEFPYKGTTNRINISPRWRWSLGIATRQPLEVAVPGSVPVAFKGTPEAISALSRIEAGNMVGGLSPEFRFLGGLSADPSVSEIATTRGLWEGLETHAAPAATGGSEIAFLYKSPRQQRLADLTSGRPLSPAELIERDHLAGMGVSPTVPAVLEMAAFNPKVWRVSHADIDPQAKIAQSPSAYYQNLSAKKVTAAQQLFLQSDTPENREMLKTALSDYWGTGVKVPARDVAEHLITRIAMTARAQGVQSLILPDNLRLPAQRLAEKWGVTAGDLTAKTGEKGSVQLPLPQTLGEAAQGAGYVVTPRLPKFNIMVPALVAPMANIAAGQGWITDEQAAALDVAAVGAMAYHSGLLNKRNLTNPSTILGGIGAGTGFMLSGGDGWMGLAGGTAGMMLGSGLNRAFMQMTPLGKAMDALRETHPIAGTFDRTPTPSRLGFKERFTNFVTRQTPEDTQEASPFVASTVKGRQVVGPGYPSPEWLYNAPYPAIRAMGRMAVPAINLFRNFNRRTGEVNGQVGDMMRQVYGPMKSYDQVDLFHRILMAGDRLERYQARVLAGQEAKIPQLVNGGPEVTGSDLNAYYRELSTLRQSQPEVTEALTRYHDLMQNMGEQMVKRGWMSTETLNAHQHYFENIVLQDPALATNGTTLREAMQKRAMGSTSPIRKGIQPYAKQAKGTTLPVFSNPEEVIPAYTSMLLNDAHKDDLVKELAAMYGPGSALGDAWIAKAKKPFTEIQWDSPNGESTTYALPDEIALELTRIHAPLPVGWQMLTHLTSAAKAPMLLSGGIPFILRNILGDWTKVFTETKLSELPQLGKGMIHAAQYTARGLGYGEPDPKVMAIMDKLSAEGVGTGGAVANTSEISRFSPWFRRLQVDPRAPGGSRFRKGLSEPLALGRFGFDQLRGITEGISRLGAAEAEAIRLAGGWEKWMALENGSPAQKEIIARAANLGDAKAVSYTDITHFQNRILKAVVQPFATWFIKTGQSYAPFIMQDPISGSRWGWTSLETPVATPDNPNPIPSIPRPSRNQIAAQKLAMSLTAGVLLTMWNETHYKEYEDNLDPNLRNVPHLWLANPFDSGKVMRLSAPGPLNTIAGFVGWQGGVRRVADVMLGRSSAPQEWDSMLKDMRENWVSTLSPLLTIPFGLAFGVDPRNGQPVVDKQAPIKDQILGRFEMALKQMPFVSQAFRASRITPNQGNQGDDVPDSSGKFLYQMVVGSLWDNVDATKLEQMKAIASAKTEFNALADEIQQRGAERYLAEMQPGGTIRSIPGTKGPLPIMTIDKMREMGPTAALHLYALGRMASGKGKMPSLLASMGDLSSTLSREGGGQVPETPQYEGQKTISWAQAAAMINYAQVWDRIPSYARQGVVEALKKRGHVPEWAGGGR